MFTVLCFVGSRLKLLCIFATHLSKLLLDLLMLIKFNYGSILGHKLIVGMIVPYFANVMFNYISIIVFCVCSLILQMLCDVMTYIESIKNKTMVLSLLHLSHTLKSSRLQYVSK